MKSCIFSIRTILVIFCISLFCVSLTWAAPQVWVDDDYNSSTPGWGTTNFDNVTTGIYNVDPGGIVTVYAGTYTEDLAINKSLTLDGASSQTVILQPVGAQIDPVFWAPTHILITASNVTVQNVQLSGNEAVCDEGIMIEDCDNVTIQHCDIHNYNSDAIYCLESTGTDINDNINLLNNKVYHIRQNNNNIGWNTTVFALENTACTIEGNTITTCSVGYTIYTSSVDGYPVLPSRPVIKNNIIEDQYEPLTGGVLRTNRAILCGDPVIITDNKIDNVNYGMQVQLQTAGSAPFDGDILIQNNTITNMRPSVEPTNNTAIGIYLNSIRNQAARVVQVLDNVVDGVNGDPGNGIGLFTWSTDAGTITWDNNSVSGFGLGADFRADATTTIFQNNIIDLPEADNLAANTDLGIRLRDTSSVAFDGNSISGFDTGVQVLGTDTADLGTGPLGATGLNTLFDNGTGVDVDGGAATVGNSDITSHTTGILVQNSGSVDLDGNEISLCFTGVQGDSGGDITNADNNDIHTNTNGIHVTNTATVSSTSGNDIHGNAVGVLSDNNGDLAGLSSNDIYSNSIGIDITDSGQASLVNRNSIYSNGTGIRVVDSGNLASATENIITGNTGDGILVTTNATAGTVGSISGNSLHSNGGADVNNTTAVDINCSANWWGTADALLMAGIAGANVDFTPWLASSQDIALTAGFQGDFSELWCNSTSPQTGASSRIQEAVDTVDNQGIVNLAWGVFTELTNITGKSVGLVGEDEAGVIVQATAGAPINLFNCFTVNAGAGTTVTLSNMTVRNGDYGIRSTSGDVSILNCTFYHNGYDGVAYPGGVDQAGAGVHYAAHAIDGGAIRIRDGNGGEISGCMVYENDRGIRITDCTGYSINNNESYGNIQAGIYLASSTYDGTAGCQDTVVQLNQSYDNKNNGILSIGGLNNLIENNQVYDNWNTGVMMWHPGEIRVTDSTIQNNCLQTFNGEGNLGDSFGGIYADGATVNGAAAYAYEVTFCTIDNNQAGRLARATGIYSGSPLPALPILIQGNDFTSQATDVWIAAQAATTGILENNLSGSTSGVQNDDAVQVLADNNWWGSYTGPGNTDGGGRTATASVGLVNSSPWTYGEWRTDFDGDTIDDSNDPDDDNDGFTDLQEVALVSDQLDPTDPSPTGTDIVWVDDDWSTGVLYENLGGGRYFGINAFDTVQGGVGAVATSGTVQIYNGNYPETGQIVMDHHMYIIGETKSGVVIRPNQNTGAVGDARGWILIDAGIELNLTSVTLDGQGFDIEEGLRVNGTAVVDNIHIRNITAPAYGGDALVFLGDDSEATSNTIYGFGSAGILGQFAQNLEILDNSITGLGAGDYLNYGIALEHGAGGLILDNIIEDCSGLAGGTDPSIGILVTTDSSDPLYPGYDSIATITGNIIRDNQVGIQVGVSGVYPETASITANQNLITNNIAYGINVMPSANQQDAEDNWWGTISWGGYDGMPGVSDIANGDADVDPWAGNTAFTIQYTIPASTVADDDNTGLSEGDVATNGGTYGYDEFDSVDDAVANVMASGTVTVMNGTYTEAVQITKAVSINGESEAGVIVQANAAGPVDGTNCFTIAAGLGNVVSIQNMTIRNGDYGIRSSSGNVDVLYCTLYHNGYDGTDYTTPTTQASAGTDYATYGTDGGAIRIHDSTDSEVAWCTVYENDRGIRLNNCSNGYVHDNLSYDNIQSGIYLAYSGGNGCTDTLVEDNISHSNMNNGILVLGGNNNTIRSNEVYDNWNTGIHTHYPSDFTFTNNTVYGNSIYGFNGEGNVGNSDGGFAAAGAPLIAATTDTLTLLNNNIYDNNTGNLAASTGIYLSTALDGSGITVTGNLLSGQDRGIWVRSQAATTIISSNSIEAGVMAVMNDDAALLDAGLNWVGAADAASVAAVISANVDYSPWLTSPLDGSAAQGFQGDLASLGADNDSPVSGAEPHIREAVAEVENGGTISVYEGTYNEGIDITKALSLFAPDGISSTTLDGTGTARPFSGGLDIPIVFESSGSDSVTVSDFHVTNSRTGILARDPGSNIGDSLSVSGCLFDNILAAGIAVDVQGVRGDIQGNNFNGPGAGVRIANASDSIISGNTITGGQNYGISISDQVIGSVPADTCENITIQGNTITNLTSTFSTQAYGIFIGRSDGTGTLPFAKNVTVADNTITTCGHTGIIFAGVNEPGDGSMLIQNNDVFDCGKYAGITFDGLWASDSFASQSYNVTIDNNEVRNHVDNGIVIQSGEIRIQNNWITDNFTGILVNGGTVDCGNGPLGSVGLNHIQDNSDQNLRNVPNVDMKAELNWWGYYTYAQVEDTIYHKPDPGTQGLVDFIPFKGMTDPNVVWADPTYDTSTFGFGYDHFTNISDGLTAVTDPGTVMVADGVYDFEDSYPLEVEKSLAINGTSTTGTIVRNPAATVDTVAETGSVLVTVSADNVGIYDMCLDGDSDILSDGTGSELGHGDGVTDNDVESLAGIVLNPAGTASTASNLTLSGLCFKNFYSGATINGRPGQAAEISTGNTVASCSFTNIGAGNEVFKSGSGVFFTSAEVEVTSSSFTMCDNGVRGVIDPLSAGVSAVSAHDNFFYDNYYGIFLDGSWNGNASAGLTTFDPDGAGPVMEGIANNDFDTSDSFRLDSDVWDAAAGDFIDHQNLDVASSATLYDSTPPTSQPDTPAGILMIGGTNPVMIVDNRISNMRRGVMVLSERGLTGDDGTVTLLSNTITGPGTDSGFDAVGILGRNRQIYGNAQAEDDFGGAVRFDMYDNSIDAAVDLVRLQEEPVAVLDPTIFDVLIGGPSLQYNTFGLVRDFAIHLGRFNLSGGGEKTDIDATYNDFLVNHHAEAEEDIYHEEDDATLGRVTYVPAKRLVSFFTLDADPDNVNAYNVIVDLTATAVDGFLDPVIDGMEVVFSTTFGDLPTTGSVTVNGEATNTIQSNIDGTAIVTATIDDGAASDNVTIVFDVMGMEDLFSYPMNNPGLEGWEVGAPSPGTYVDAKDGAYYMAPSIENPGVIGVNGDFTVNLFGYWRQSDGFEIPVTAGKIYRAIYTIRTDQPDQNKAPQARLRWNHIDHLSACSQTIDKGINAPLSGTWTDYNSYYLPPDLSGLPADDQKVYLNFDLVDFTDIQSGRLYLSQVDVQSFNDIPQSVATPVISLDSQADFSAWQNIDAPSVYGTVASGSDATGLYLESGQEPSPPSGMDGLPDYGAWELLEANSTISFEADRLYRARFTLNVPNSATQQTASRIRVRLHNAAYDWNNIYEIFPGNTGGYKDHMPSPGGTEYSILMDSPILYGSGQENLNRMSFGFDIVDGVTEQYGRVYLDKLEVEYYDIP